MTASLCSDMTTSWRLDALNLRHREMKTTGGEKTGRRSGRSTEEEPVWDAPDFSAGGPRDTSFSCGAFVARILGRRQEEVEVAVQDQVEATGTLARTCVANQRRRAQRVTPHHAAARR